MDSLSTNPLRRLQALGQSVWLDDLSRGLIESGALAQMIRDDGISGVTTNPAILHHAITSGHDYDAGIRTAPAGASAEQLYEWLVLDDVGRAADLLRPVYERTHGHDGYVSLEVSPQLARDTGRTVAEARRLFAKLARPNVMIKVPGTREGLPAVRALIADGVNINATLLFSAERCAEVAEAWMAGLEDRAAAGRPLDTVHSVASFFVSRIDTAVDRRLDALGSEVRDLRGLAAVACAQLAHSSRREIAATPRWRRLIDQGAVPQRLLWASTGTKDPASPDVKYVDALIGPDTVTTVPLATLAAYRDHGDPAPRLETAADPSTLPRKLAALGIRLDEIALQLEAEGIRKFVEPFEHLLSALAATRGTTGALS